MIEENQSQIEAIAVVINDILALSGVDHAAVLAKAAEFYAEANPDPNPKVHYLLKFSDMSEWDKSPGRRHHGRITRLKAWVAYAFIRTIANNNSPEDAARLLFERHHGGPGSGCLQDYLPKDRDKPKIRRNPFVS